MTANRIFATLALTAVLGTAHAARILEQPERSYELSLSQMTLPSNPTGGLTVKRCPDCAYSTHVLTAATQYRVNEQLVPFGEFSRIAAELRANRATVRKVFIGVYIDAGTGRVNRVTLRQVAQ